MTQMLFDSSLRKELERGVLGTFVVLLTIVLTMILIRMLGLAAKGNVAATDVSLLIGYTMISQLPTLLSLAVFIAVVSLLNRLYRDSEILVWQASGVRLLRMLLPLWQMSWPILLILIGLSFWARPWSQQQLDKLRTRFEQRSEISKIAPGQFQTSSDGKRVFFIDRDSNSQSLGKNVLIVMTDNDKETVVNANEGSVEISQGMRFLNLRNGERIETNFVDGSYSRSQFESARILLGDAPVTDKIFQRSSGKSTWVLFKSNLPQDRGELAWRIGSIWSCLNLVIIGLSFATPQVRRANSWGIVWALLAFIVYFNTMSLSQNWVAAGKLSMPYALLGTHGVIMLGAMSLLYWRDGSWRKIGLAALHKEGR